jgi:hypothetical protein
MMALTTDLPLPKRRQIPESALGTCQSLEWFCHNRCAFDHSVADWLKRNRPEDEKAREFDRMFGTESVCVTDCLAENRRKKAER